ncbi:hypothetical protein BDV96DRAFT_569209 [Lophiotrema nucula]|uniref:Uncharacterized protein n=1 Tax=Lophiotrema nucula TaxID=690887 RepID=A0A6A5ZFS8_9PLEO|nr:hypothetical protein BDV96DRAFT_569209 [Lophiotrema nucula]
MHRCVLLSQYLICSLPFTLVWLPYSFASVRLHSLPSTENTRLVQIQIMRLSIIELFRKAHALPNPILRYLRL